MFNLQRYENKTIRTIQHRNGGEQIIIYFTDESFLIVTVAGSRSPRHAFDRVVSHLEFSGRALDKSGD